MNPSAITATIQTAITATIQTTTHTLITTNKNNTGHHTITQVDTRRPFVQNVTQSKTVGNHGTNGKTGDVNVEKKIPEAGAYAKNVITPASHNPRTAESANAVEEFLSNHNSVTTAKLTCPHKTTKNNHPPLPQHRRDTGKENIRNHITPNYPKPNPYNTHPLPYLNFKLPIFTMMIDNKPMKVLFDSGSSVSLITKKGNQLLKFNNITPTNIRVWAANNQKLNLKGEITLILHLDKPIKHRFLITQNDISDCHALLGTDLYPKLDSFLLSGTRDLGISLCMNNSIFSFSSHKNLNSSLLLLINKPDMGLTQYLISISNMETAYKLLDEDFDSCDEKEPINDIENGCTPDIPNASSSNERTKIFNKMLQELDLNHLNHLNRRNLLRILRTVSGLFVTSPEDPVGLIPNCVVRINTSEGEPIRAKQRKFSPILASKVKQMNTNMLTKGIIEKSCSAWSNPLVLVQKPGASTALRFCLDLRQLNKRILFDSYPIADIKTMLQTVIGHQYYSTVDISEAYFCMLIHPEDRYKLAYRTPDGLYQFCRLPFGVLTGCALWNRKFQEILADLGDSNIRAYFDDLIIFTESETTHLNLLKKVLDTLLKSGLRIKLAKCQLMKTSVKFLGFSISKHGSSPTSEGIVAVRSLKQPDNLKQLRSFLGAIGYYRDFIPNFAETASPLYDLTKKNMKFKWNIDSNKAWQSLKTTLSSKLILIAPDTNKQFFIATDATQNSIAGVLLQKNGDVLKPIEYFSRRLRPPESRYHTNETEGLAIFACFKKWEHYLLLNRTTVMTDNSSMTYIFDRKEPCNARVGRWQIYLATFRYKIIHIKGSENKLADYLSRYVDHDLLEEMTGTPTTPKSNTKPTINTEYALTMGYTTPSETTTSPSTSATEIDTSWLNITPEELRKRQELEPRWKEIINFLENEKKPSKICCRPKIKSLSDFVLNDKHILCTMSRRDNNIYLKPVIPTSLIPSALYYLHDSEWAGHPTPRKTRTIALDKFYWPTILSDTITYAKSCITCQKFREITRLYPDIINPNKIVPQFPNEALSIDIIYMQTATSGEKYILSIMDMYSRYCKFYPLRDMYAESISTSILDFCCIFGFPNLIFTDDASNLSASLSRNIFSALRIIHSVAIPYRHNPSMVERIHSPLKKGLSLLCQGAEASWPKFLSKMTYALNSTPHGSLNCTPMEAYFFRQNNPQPNLGNCTLNENCDPDLIDEIKNLRTILTQTSEEMKKTYIEKKNKDAKEQPILLPGEKVMLKREAFDPGINRKMQEIRTGPWKVITVLNTEITISLIDHPTITRRRHISHLAPFIERPNHLNTTRIPSLKLSDQLTYQYPSISIISGNFSSPIFIKPQSIIAIGIECMLRVAHGLTKETLNTFPYGSMYTKSSTIIKPNNDELLTLLRTRPSARRTPGQCIMKEPRTKRPGPKIANMTIQYSPGKAIDNGGVQTEYLTQHNKYLDSNTKELLIKDTVENRLTWFEQALSDTRKQIFLNEIPPSNIYIPKNIGCGFSGGNTDQYIKILNKFASIMHLSGFNTILVEKF